MILAIPDFSRITSLSTDLVFFLATRFVLLLLLFGEVSFVLEDTVSFRYDKI